LGMVAWRGAGGAFWATIQTEGKGFARSIGYASSSTVVAIPDEARVSALSAKISPHRASCDIRVNSPLGLTTKTRHSWPASVASPEQQIMYAAAPSVRSRYQPQSSAAG